MLSFALPVHRVSFGCLVRLDVHVTSAQRASVDLSLGASNGGRCSSVRASEASASTVHASMHKPSQAPWSPIRWILHRSPPGASSPARRPLPRAAQHELWRLGAAVDRRAEPRRPRGARLDARVRVLDPRAARRHLRLRAPDAYAGSEGRWERGVEKKENATLRRRNTRR
eukprot:6206747-Pleurochrysis_carterae.AAC.4